MSSVVSQLWFGCSQAHGGQQVLMRIGLLRFIKSPHIVARIRRLTMIGFALTAVINWWMVIDEGPSDARVITAVVTTLVVVVELTLRRRRRDAEEIL